MTRDRSVPGSRNRISMRQQVLLAALDCCGGDLEGIFTAEDLLLSAWKRDPLTWGLRDHEHEHPDSEKIYTELDRATVKGTNVRGGLAGLGLLERVRQRTYRLTPTGLAAASEVVGADSSAKGKVERVLSDAISQILSHPVFRGWIADSSAPRYFRDAGHFWGIAPGTPPSVIRSRIGEIDRTTDVLAAQHGRPLFDRNDVTRARDFQNALKSRFSRDLATLGVDVLPD
jgi:hypothetical protein